MKSESIKVGFSCRFRDLNVGVYSRDVYVREMWKLLLYVTEIYLIQSVEARQLFISFSIWSPESAAKFH